MPESAARESARATAAPRWGSSLLSFVTGRERVALKATREEP
jgi:hypothetical protein